MPDRRPLPYALLVIACTLADWALTVDALQTGFATELNPIGQLVLDQGTGASLALKVVLTIPGAMLLAMLSRRSRLAYYGLVACAWLGLALVVWHVIGRVIVFG